MLKLFTLSLQRIPHRNPFRKNVPFKRFSEVQIQLPPRIFEEKDFLHEDYLSLEGELIRCGNEKEVVHFFKTKGHKIPVELLSQITEKIVRSQMDLTQQFNQECAPIIAEYILKMNKDYSLTYGRLLKDFAFMDINSPIIWDALLTTFNKEKMFRYVPIPLLAEAFISFSMNADPPKEVLKMIIPVLYGHRYRLNSETLDQIIKGLNRLKNDEYKSKFEHSKTEYPINSKLASH